MTVTAIVATLVVGIILLLIELMVVPGFGVAGVLGICALVAGAMGAWTELGPTWGVAIGVASVVLSGITLYVFPRTRAGKRMILEDAQRNTTAQTARRDLINQRGKALTPLRPTGVARFGVDEVDVITEGEYIESGKPVVVTQIEGTRVVVRAATE